MVVKLKPVPEVSHAVNPADLEATHPDGTAPKQSINANGGIFASLAGMVKAAEQYMNQAK